MLTPFECASHAFNNENFEDALLLCDQALIDTPDDVPLLTLRAKIFTHASSLERRSGDGASSSTNIEDGNKASDPPCKSSGQVPSAKIHAGSAKKSAKDWDAIAAQLDSDSDDGKPEGEDALNELFQKIYRNADEDTRRAMNKSFVESGGTVLSTDWKDVGSKKIEPEAP
jgi:hypothetical protein